MNTMSRTAWLLSRGYAISGGAVSAVKTWQSGEVLFASDLVAEFANILNNGQALGNPWTTNQAAGANDLTGLDELALDDAATTPTAAGRLRRNGVILQWREATTAQIQAYTAAANGEAILGVQNDAQTWHVKVTTDDSFVIRDNTTGPTNRVIISPAGVFTLTGSINSVSGTPTANALYRESLVKGWLKCNFGGTISDSYNVSSITDAGTGLVTVTWDRDFANANYSVSAVVDAATPNPSGGVGFIATIVSSSQAVGSVQLQVYDQNGGAADGTFLHVMAAGDQ
jgi:hypothetical protein